MEKNYRVKNYYSQVADCNSTRYINAPNLKTEIEKNANAVASVTDMFTRRINLLAKLFTKVLQV